MSDPFEQLIEPVRPIRPREAFARDLRARIVAELGLTGPDLSAAPEPGDLDDVPEVPLPARAAVDITRPSTNTSTSSPTSPSTRRSAMSPTTEQHPDLSATAVTVVPYLAVAGAAAALDFYQRAFGAEEHHRVLGPDGAVGHAEFHIGGAVFYLSDAYPELGVQSPSDLGGTAVSLHVSVPDVDEVFGRAVEAGATALSEPADQPHGARHGTLVDPFGHRWMISQQLRQLDLDSYRSEMADSGWAVEQGPGAAQATTAPTGDNGRIWAAVNAEDAPAMIRLLVDVMGFTEQLVVPGDEPGVVVHSQLRWPEGGTVQVSTANRPDNVFSQRPIGAENLYVITEEPLAIYERCQEAGLEVVAEPTVPDYDNTGKPTFSVRDHEGNIWSFGAYAGEA